MRFEKFAFQQLNTPPTVLHGKVGTSARFVPPSLVPEPEIALQPAEPVFNESQVKDAEQTGYCRGFLEGEKELREQAEAAAGKLQQDLLNAVEKLAGNVHRMMTEYNQFSQTQRGELPKLALAIARKVAGQALKNDPMPAIESMVKTCVDRLLPQPHIVITVAEPLVAALRERLAEYYAHNQDPGEISIEGNPALTAADCKIVWEHGTAARSTASLWREMEALVESMADGAPEIIETQLADNEIITDSIPESPHPEGA